ncbi:MAG TPA: MoaD/ThiS family protein [Firmicutes bacterium]|nr:MoaD/ThiS family protein [Candidatus Fermentithermobacillaceae bacterium]
MAGQLRVQAKIYGDLIRFVEGQREVVTVQLREGASLSDLLRVLGIPAEEVWMASRRNQIIREEDILEDGDEVSLFDPVLGG